MREPTTKNLEYADKLAKQLIEQLEKGSAPWQKPWNPALGNDLPHNLSTGNQYNGGNVLTLMIQDYKDPRWMTFRQAKELGANVRKGEKSTKIAKLIVANQDNKADAKDKAAAQEKEPVDSEGKPHSKAYLKWYDVFNGEQIDGLEKWQSVPMQLNWNPDSRAEELLKASKANIQQKFSNSAFYLPKEDKIILPEKSQFDTSGDYYATALHELGHWTGHPERLKRDLSGKMYSESYAKEELRAEISSMMVTRQLGLEHKPDRHAAYVASWIKVLQDDPMEVFNAARDASRIQNYVMGFERNLERPAYSAERLEQSKDHYQHEVSKLKPDEQNLCNGLEKMTISFANGLPEEHKLTAMTNFYEAQAVDLPKQVQNLNMKLAKSSSQENSLSTQYEFGFER